MLASTKNAAASERGSFRGGSLEWEGIPLPDKHDVAGLRIKIDLALWRGSPLFAGRSVEDGLEHLGSWATFRITDSTGRASSYLLDRQMLISENVAEGWVYTSGSYESGRTPDSPPVEEHFRLKRWSGPYSVTFEICCRTEAIEQYSDQTFRLKTKIDPSTIDWVNGSRSPRSRILPVMYCEQGKTCVMALPADASFGLPLTYRFASSAESGLRSPVPGTSPPQPSLATLSPSGTLSWNTTGVAVGPYQTQVVLVESDGAKIYATTPVDFRIQVVPALDGARPSVRIDQADDQRDPTSSSPITFTVVFSEPVTGFEPSDVVLSGLANPSAASVSGSGTTYRVDVSGMSGSGTVSATVREHAAVDAAGNTSLASTSSDNSVTYDATPPVLTLPTTIAADATSPAGTAVVYTATATDDSGAASLVCAPASGSAFPIGSTGVTCTATDAAGNAATGSFLVTVNGAEEQLVVLAAKVAGQGPGKSLEAKIRTAKEAVADGRIADACVALDDFRNAVSAQSGKKLTVTQSEEMTADATRIRAVLACG